MGLRLISLASAGVVFAVAGMAGGQVNTAVAHHDYVAGGDESLNYRTPGSALGLPNPVNEPFDNTILSPFNPPWMSSSIAIVGSGGQITLELSQAITPDPTRREIGVFSNNGLDDNAWPAGQNKNPAVLFSPASLAKVSVSADKQTWIALSADSFTFANPTNYYSDLGANPAYTDDPGTQVADFTKQFTGVLSDFNNLNWAQTKALLDGSAGGTWLDISVSGVTSVKYIRFEVPAGEGNRMVIDGISAVPEPSTLGMVAMVGLLMARRRQRD